MYCFLLKRLKKRRGQSSYISTFVSYFFLTYASNNICDLLTSLLNKSVILGQVNQSGVHQVFLVVFLCIASSAQ